MNYFKYYSGFMSIACLLWFFWFLYFSKSEFRVLYMLFEFLIAWTGIYFYTGEVKNDKLKKEKEFEVTLEGKTISDLLITPKEEGCIFCGTKRKWYSTLYLGFRIGLEGSDTIRASASACPKCRSEHSVQDLYEKIIESLSVKFKEDVKAFAKKL